ncbi:hypothetical protein ACFL04_04555 [Patescibacteria group bacterium]
MTLVIIVALISLIGYYKIIYTPEVEEMEDKSNGLKYDIVEKINQGDYTVINYLDERKWDGAFEILYKDELIYYEGRKNVKYYIIDESPGSDIPPLPAMITDITGDGGDNLVMMAWTGGAGCCNEYYIYSLSNSDVFLLDKLDGVRTYVWFEDMDGDGALEAQLLDWTYKYWVAPQNMSPTPDIVMKYKKGVYVLAPELMIKPLPLKSELDAKSTALREKMGKRHGEMWDPESNSPYIDEGNILLWREMLDLIYTGYGEEAMDFYYASWPEGATFIDYFEVEWSRDAFLPEFISLLKSSPHWDGVNSINNWGDYQELIN